MKVKVLFFSAAAEITGVGFNYLENVQTTDEVTAELLKKFPEIKAMNCRFALNKVILNENVPLNDGDEMAVLPPFSGG